MNRSLRLSIGFILILGLLGSLHGETSRATQNTSASLTLDIYTCAVTEDPMDLFSIDPNDCHLGTDDIPFTLAPISVQGGEMMASTGSGGRPATISFTQLVPGTYRLIQHASATVARSYIARCTSNVREFDYPFAPFATIGPEGRLDVELLPDEQLVCDWIDIRANDSGRIWLSPEYLGSIIGDRLFQTFVQ